MKVPGPSNRKAAKKKAKNSSHNKLHKALCLLLKEMLRDDPSAGMGKPEPLKHNLSGFWSRRISRMDRVIYQFDDENLFIFAIGGHYDSL